MHPKSSASSLVDTPFISDLNKARCTIKQPQNLNPAGLAVSRARSRLRVVAGHLDMLRFRNNTFRRPKLVLKLTRPRRRLEVREPTILAMAARATRRRKSMWTPATPTTLTTTRSTRAAVTSATQNSVVSCPNQVRRAAAPDSSLQTERGAFAVRRKLRDQRVEMKEVMRRSQETGGAIEYRGPLNRAELVSWRSWRCGGGCIFCLHIDGARLQNCNSLNCTQISCEIGKLEAEEYVLVEVYSRLWLNTLVDNGYIEAEDYGSLAFAQITSLPFAPRFTPPAQALGVFTKVNPIDPEQTTSVPWWLILLAILVALLILALIIWCCYKASRALFVIANMSFAFLVRLLQAKSASLCLCAGDEPKHTMQKRSIIHVLGEGKTQQIGHRIRLLKTPFATLNFFHPPARPPARSLARLLP